MCAPQIDVSAVLASISEGLRNALVDSLNEIARNFREGRWEPSELNGGKLCEVVYTILKGHVEGSFPPAPAKPKNMVLKRACRGMAVCQTFTVSGIVATVPLLASTRTWPRYRPGTAARGTSRRTHMG